MPKRTKQPRIKTQFESVIDHITKIRRISAKVARQIDSLAAGEQASVLCSLIESHKRLYPALWGLDVPESTTTESTTTSAAPDERPPAAGRYES